MEFRPDHRTLLVNYAVTLGVLGLVLFVSFGSREDFTRKISQFYYSPAYTSHMSRAYGSDTQFSCASCHTTNWKTVEEPSCYTGGCHNLFNKGNPPRDMLQIVSDESGKPKPNLGAILAFHQQVREMSCEECHPSHRLPSQGRFNSTTINIRMKTADTEKEQVALAGGSAASGETAAPPATSPFKRTLPAGAAGESAAATAAAPLTAEQLRAEKRSRIFHEDMRHFVSQAQACHVCHVAPANDHHPWLLASYAGAAAETPIGCNECHVATGRWTATSRTRNVPPR